MSLSPVFAFDVPDDGNRDRGSLRGRRVSGDAGGRTDLLRRAPACKREAHHTGQGKRRRPPLP
jgi:hypothetical protein